MMTAMARLPCKQTSPSEQPRYSSLSVTSDSNSIQSHNYSEMQQPVSHPLQTLPRSHHRLHGEHVGMYNGKRKSAVELLQESKAFYVKSEVVLDRKQELKNSGHLQVSQVTVPGAPPRLLRKCTTPQGCGIQQQQQLQQQQQQQQQPCRWAICNEPDRQEGVLSPQRALPPALPPKSPRLVPLPQRRSVPVFSQSTGNPGAEQLQTKLRRLLNTDSKENVFFPEAGLPVPPEYTTPQMLTSSSVQGHSAWEDKCGYGQGVSLSPGCREDESTQQQQWSPALGAEARFKFGRSNSHSHGVRSGRPGSGRFGHGGSSSSAIETAIAVPCHKSLPDLHKSTRRRSSLSPQISNKALRKAHMSGGCPDCETGSDYSDQSFNRDSVCYRSSLHIRRSIGSGGGDRSSILSLSGRTHKSSGSSKLSHGANAKDSGGSSGHYTHRSEPPPKIQDCFSQVRRDSGASTQHSTERDRSRKSNSYNGTPPAIVRHCSSNTDSSNSQTDYSPTCNSSRFSDGWKESRGRPILRSKSDISERYWRQEGGSRAPKVPSRQPRSVTQLETFFDRLGLDQDNYQHMTEDSSKASSPVFFDSVSSVDSALGLYLGWPNNGRTSPWPNSCSAGNTNNDECLGGGGPGAPGPGGQRIGDQPSIVERNARIIKWLCQCRKVQFGYS